MATGAEVDATKKWNQSIAPAVPAQTTYLLGGAPMAYWLLKTEPEEYSYADLEQRGRDAWDGVKNPTAQRHLRSMQPGDLAFVYHTGKERAVVGIARVVSAPYPDPAAPEKRVLVDLSPVERLGRPVTLAEIKADPAFLGWELVRLSRLSVMPVPEPLWHRILALAGSPAS